MLDHEAGGPQMIISHGSLSHTVARARQLVGPTWSPTIHGRDGELKDLDERDGELKDVDVANFCVIFEFHLIIITVWSMALKIYRFYKSIIFFFSDMFHSDLSQNMGPVTLSGVVTTVG